MDFKAFLKYLKEKHQLNKNNKDSNQLNITFGGGATKSWGESRFVLVGHFD